MKRIPLPSWQLHGGLPGNVISALAVAAGLCAALSLSAPPALAQQEPDWPTSSPHARQGRPQQGEARNDGARQDGARDGGGDGAVHPKPGEPDGVKVGKKFGFDGIGVSESSIERQAFQQYGSLKQDAAQKGVLLPDSHPDTIRLRRIARQLIPFATRWNERAPSWKWEVILLESKQVNAFCMPGGKIAFYTGILNTLRLTDDEVAAVMGHEIAHALREHGRERANKSLATSVGAQLLGAIVSHKFGVDPRVADTVAQGGAKLAVLSFSRSDESEADLVGLDLAARAGYDPRAGIALWKKMDAVNKGAPPQWLSTHPAGKARIAEMQKNMKDVLPLFARARNTTVAQLPPYRSNVNEWEPIR